MPRWSTAFRANRRRPAVVEEEEWPDETRVSGNKGLEKHSRTIARSRGRRVRILSGKYADYRKAWYDKANKETKCFVPVVILFREGPNLVYRTVRVSKEFVEVYRVPRSYAEAAVFQHKDLSKALESLAKKFAECNLRGTEDVMSLVKRSLDKAHESRVIAGGNFRHVDFQNTEEDEEEEVDEGDMEYGTCVICDRPGPCGLTCGHCGEDSGAIYA